MKSLFLAIILLFCSQFAAAEPAAPRVAASIPPIHSLTAALMHGAGSPQLLLRTDSSPHSAALRPSEMAAIAAADLIVWVGPELEQFLVKPLRASGQGDRLLTLLKLNSLDRYPVRDGGVWAEHNEHADEDEHGHAHQATHDSHIWLSPANAERIAAAIRDRLIALDPQRRQLYNANFATLQRRLQQLDRELQQALGPVATTPYIVFHDAYQTFERRYGLHAAGSVSIDPERRPGARRLQQIRRYLQSSDAVCLFSEPQFEPRYITPLTEGTAIRTGVLDPLGSTQQPGPELYFALMREMAASLASCLAPPASGR